MNSPDILAHFQEADTTCIILGRYDVLKFPKYHNCSKVYQCRPLWQYGKTQDVIYLGSMYYAVYQHFLSAIIHLDYHPSMHADDNPVHHARLPQEI